MPTRPGFQPYGGARLRTTRGKMVASEAKSIGDVLVHTSGANTFELGATDGVFAAVYHDADRSAALTDTPYKTIIPITPDMEWYAPIESGTGATTLVGTYVDLNSADGLDVGTSTKDDFIITKHISTTLCVGRFNSTTATLPGA